MSPPYTWSNPDRRRAKCHREKWPDFGEHNCAESALWKSPNSVEFGPHLADIVLKPAEIGRTLAELGPDLAEIAQRWSKLAKPLTELEKHFGPNRTTVVEFGPISPPTGPNLATEFPAMSPKIPPQKQHCPRCLRKAPIWRGGGGRKGFSGAGVACCAPGAPATLSLGVQNLSRGRSAEGDQERPELPPPHNTMSEHRHKIVTQDRDTISGHKIGILSVVGVQASPN